MQKILILLLYYERPVMVMNALNSILSSNYSNWHLAVIDDSSPTSCRPIVESVMAGHLNKVSFYHTNTSVDEKMANGSVFGKYMNHAIEGSDAELAIMLCDDDELEINYMSNLNNFFENHRSVKACYSHIHLYNPAYEISLNVDNVLLSSNCPLHYNKHTTKINPFNRVDASQVAWRTSLNKEDNVWFNYPKTRNLDRDFYQSLVHVVGRIPFSGFVSQYKSSNSYQLKFLDERDIWNGKSIDLDELKKRTDPMDLVDIIHRYARQGNFDEAYRIRKEALAIHPDNKYLKDIIIDKYSPLSKCPYRSPRVVSLFLKDIISDKVVCELGSGDGDNMIFMSEYAKKVIGVEFDSLKYDISISRGLDVSFGSYREIEIPQADIYYFWPTEAQSDNSYLIKLILGREFHGKIVIGADSGYAPEIPVIKDCAKLGSLFSVKYDEGPGHREHGEFLLAIIDADIARNTLAQ